MILGKCVEIQTNSNPFSAPSIFVGINYLLLFLINSVSNCGMHSFSRYYNLLSTNVYYNWSSKPYLNLKLIFTNSNYIFRKCIECIYCIEYKYIVFRNKNTNMSYTLEFILLCI